MGYLRFVWILFLSLLEMVTAAENEKMVLLTIRVAWLADRLVEIPQ